mgnify:CR=1 FL=1
MRLELVKPAAEHRKRLKNSGRNSSIAVKR